MADYDGDGRADLLSGSTCCNGTCFYLFRRKPDGTFGPLERIVLDFPKPDFNVLDLPINGLKSRVAVADWNGDGHSDLLVTGASAPAIAYGPLGGKDSIKVKRLWPKGQEAVRYLSTNPILADWDEDGLIDLVGGTYTARDAARRKYTYDVSWWRNVGTRTGPKLGPSQRLVHVSDDTYSYPTGVAVADWDADGKLDLLVSRMEREMPNKSVAVYTVKEHMIWVYLRLGK